MKIRSGESAVLMVLIFVFLLLLSFQVYFAFHKDIQEESRAERLGGQFTKEENTNVAVEKREEGLFIFLTFETKNGASSRCKLLLNDEVIGDFQGGILSINGHEGDTISFEGGKKGEVISLMEIPKNLDGDFPKEVVLTAGKIDWGQISIK